MAFQAAPNTIKIVFEGMQNNVPVVNIYHVQTPTTPVHGDLTATINVFLAWWVDTVRGGIHESYILQSIVATDISIENGEQVTYQLLADGDGAATGEPCAGNGAMVISWRSGLTGRSNRGRTYIGGLPQSALATAQNLDTSYALSYAVAGTELIDAVAALGSKLVIVSRWLNNARRAVALIIEIVEVIVDTKVDSQSRRTAN